MPKRHHDVYSQNRYFNLQRAIEPVRFPWMRHDDLKTHQGVHLQMQLEGVPRRRVHRLRSRAMIFRVVQRCPAAVPVRSNTA